MFTGLILKQKAKVIVVVVAAAAAVVAAYAHMCLLCNCCLTRSSIVILRLQPEQSN